MRRMKSMKRKCEIAIALALSLIMLFCGCATSGETEKSAAETSAGETTPVKAYEGFVDYDTYGEGVANWVDDFYKDGANIGEDGAAKAGLVKCDYKFDSGDYGLDDITVRGWLGLGGEISQLGYSFDGAEAVYVDAIEDTEDAVRSVAGEFAVRFEISIDVSELSVGSHTINLVAKLSDGREIIFNGAYKEPEMQGSLPYNGNIITTITYEAKERREIPVSEKGAELCKQAKIVADFCRKNGFTYGNASINPGINWADLSADTAINPNERLVSCDRLVCWALYRAGYTDQPYTNGLVVSLLPEINMQNRLQSWGFIKITRWEDLQPGDIVFVGKAGADHPGHVYIHEKWAGEAGGDAEYRYDAGSDYRIQLVQPFVQTMSDAHDIFWYAYRPV